MAFRITNSMMVSTFNRNLRNNSFKLETLQSQLATNKKNVRLSDDPVSVVKILNAKARQNDVAQFERNLDDAAAWLTNTETALRESVTIIKRAYELAVYAANDVMGPEERKAVSLEITQLRDQMLTLGNATLGDKYIFGGYNVTYAPFAADAETGEIMLNGEDMLFADGDPQSIIYQINRGTIDFDALETSDPFYVALSGNAFMGVGEYNVWYTLNQFALALSEGAEVIDEDFLGEYPERYDEAKFGELQSFVDRFQRIESNILTNMAEVGGRIARIDLMRDRYAVDAINYTQMLSDVQDLDQAEGIMRFTMAEAVYRASLNVGGRVLPPSLADFLR
ncbi:MAG: flagellar hook-associated protein FlgL [Oscillospiraceae bacterium]|nr:flagellar hook-associated protein FlgL [Oscillospiraceae bacterium]